VLRRRSKRRQLDEVLEVLHGIGTILMEIDYKLERLLQRIGDDEDEEEAGS
jgi:hypothetical protein